MNSIQNKQSRYQTITTGKSKLALGCLTALTICLQSAPFTPVDAKSSKSDTKQSMKKHSRYSKSRKNQIARLPFAKKDDDGEDDDDDKKGKSKKKKSKKKRKDSKKKKSKLDEKKELKDKDSEKGKPLSEDKDENGEDIEVIEIDQDEKTEESKQETTESKNPEATEADTKTKSEKPRLLPDDALISLLKDVSQLLEPAEKGVEGENPDEKKIIGLARRILSKSLDIDGIEANRILDPEFKNSTNPQMIVEAWSSGDVKVSDDLRGSVAAVWGKRVGGLLNVTIAGDSGSLASSNGSKIGKFLVVVSGKCSVKEGKDIQTQKKVPYWWLGEVATINVDAACLAKIEKEDQSDESEDEKSQKSEDNTLKKKSLVILEEILTDRKREYLALFETYQKEQEAEEKARLAQANKEEQADKTADSASKQKVASKQNSNYYPEGVEIIEVEEVIEPPKEDQDERSIESDYYHIQAPESKPLTKRKRTTRRIIRYPKGMKKQDVDNLIAEKSTAANSAEAKEEDNSEELDKQETESSKAKQVEVKSQEEKPEPKKESEEVDTDKGDESGSSDSELKTAKNTNKTEETEKAEEESLDTKESENKEKDSDSKAISDKNKIDKEKNSTQVEAAEDSSKDKKQKKVKTAKTEETTNSADDKTSEKTATENEDTEKARLASITTTAPIKPRINPSPSPATVSSRKWESPASTFVTRQPSLGATVVYPARAIAGKFLTVAVVDKEGKPEASVELSFNGATLTTDANGQAMFMVPEDATPGRTLHISLSARPELNPGVVEVLQPLFATTETVAPRIDRASQLVSSAKAMIIDGHDFLGMANKNRVLVDSEDNAKVIASSPVQLRLKLPENLSPGKHKANIANTVLRSNPIYFEFIKAEIVEAKKKKRERGNIIVKVKGTKKRVPVRIVNKTPDIVRIDKGNDLLVTTSGGVDNSSKVEIKRLKKGDFKIEAKIEI